MRQGSDAYLMRLARVEPFLAVTSMNDPSAARLIVIVSPGLTRICELDSDCCQTCPLSSVTTSRSAALRSTVVTFAEMLSAVTTPARSRWACCDRPKSSGGSRTAGDATAAFDAARGAVAVATPEAGLAVVASVRLEAAAGAAGVYPNALS